MSAEAILDALATKAGAVTGIKRAYGSGAGDATVSTLPDAIADGPVAVVTYEGTTPITRAFNTEDVQHAFLIRVYVSDHGAGVAFKTLLPFVTRFIVALRSDMDLGGACAWSDFEGIDAPEAVDLSGRQFLVLPIRVVARELTHGSLYTT